MKMKNLKIAAALLACTALFAGCDLLENVASTPTVSLTALSDSFDAQGEANIAVALSSYALEEVTVSLAVSGNAAAAVTMDKVVKIGMGSKNQALTVKVDLEQIKEDSSVTIAIQSAVGATVGTPKEVTLSVKAAEVTPVEDPGVVSISADDEFAADATANVTLKLNKALAEDVSVELQVLSSDDYVTVPAEALAFTNPVVIKGGETTASVKVTVNPELLPTGDNYALIGIKAVTGNASAAKDSEVLIVYVKALVPVLREDWAIEYLGNYEYATSDSTSVLYDLVGFAGLGEQSFIVDYYTAGTLEYNKMTPADYVLYMDELIKSKIASGATADDFDIVTPTADPYYLLFNLFDPKEYEMIVLACNEDGSLTGDYAYTTFVVEDPEEATPEYEAWLGKWTISGDTFYFDRGWNNKTVKVWGFDSGYSLCAIADYNKENDTLEFRFQYMDESTNYEYYLGGIDSTNSYYAFGDEEQGDLMAILSATTDGYSFDPVTYAVDESSYGVASLTVGSIGILGWSKADQKLYFFNNVTYYSLPNTNVVKVQGVTASARKSMNGFKPLAKGFPIDAAQKHFNKGHKASMAIAQK